MSIPMVISLGGGYSFPSISLSVMTADATIIATTKAEIEAAINALPSNMGQYSIFLQYPDGSSASDYDFDIDVVNKHNGNFVFEAENALSAAGTNQPVEFIFDDPNKRINFINCNLTAIRDSIKFTGVENGQTVFIDVTNSKIGWIDRYCYDNLEACNQETIVLHGASASSNNGTFQGAADGSTTIYCSLENELNENVGDAVFIVDGTRNTIPFKHAGAGSGGVIVSNSSSAFEEDAIDVNLIALTVHSWDAYSPIPQLNASVLSLTSVSDGQAVLAIVDNNTSPNEGGKQLQYKLASEPTQWTDGVLEVTDALSITQTGLTNDLLYDFQLIDKGVALESLDSDPSNTIQGTPVIEAESSYGADIVVNGSFGANLFGWLGTNWAHSAINGGEALHTPGSIEALIGNTGQGQGEVVAAQEYVVRYRVGGTTAGTIQPTLGGNGLGVARSANGYYFEHITAGNTDTLQRFVPSSDWDGYIDEIIIQTVDGTPNMVLNGTFETADNLTLFDGWTVGGDTLNYGGANPYTSALFGMVMKFHNNIPYHQTFDVVGGPMELEISFGNEVVESGTYAIGTHPINHTPTTLTSPGSLNIKNNNSGAGSIDNVYVNEVIS